MVCRLRYAAGVGVVSSRKSAQACERHLAFIAMVGQDRPDVRPISEVRKRHLQACGDVCVPGWRLAGAAGLGKRGHGATDGTTLPGQASRHTAMSSGDRKKESARWREERAALVTQASQQDAEDAAARGSRRGDELPAAVARRADRLATSEAAMKRLEARAKAAAEAERPRRAEAEAACPCAGKTRRGNAPQAVAETPDAKAQRSCTAPEWPIMQTTKTGWDYGGHAQVSVDGACQIMVACDVTAAANDTQPAGPMAPMPAASLAPAGMEKPQDAAGVGERLVSPDDSGYAREAAAAAVEPLGVDPSRAPGRQRHHAPEGAGSAPPLTATEHMAATGRPPAGRWRRDGKGSSSRGWARAKRGGVCAGLCCAAWTTYGESGLWEV
jgi:hypothetical protein